MTDHQPEPALPAELGRLFGDGGVGRTLPVTLPAGRLVWPGGQYRIGASGRAAARPAYWLSEQPATAALWRRLRAEHDQSGLWPLLLGSLNGEPKRPWIVGEVDPESVDAIDADDPEEFLATLWTDWVEFDERHPELLGEGEDVLIIGSHYGITGLISFYLPEARRGLPALIGRRPAQARSAPASSACSAWRPAAYRSWCPDLLPHARTRAERGTGPSSSWSGLVPR